MKRSIVPLVLFHVLLSPPGVQSQGFDRLGVPVLQESDLLARPATSTPAGWVLRVVVAEPILVAGIREHSLYVHRTGARVGLATQLARQGSDIHARTTVGAALQLRAAGSAWGLAGTLQQWSFVGGFLRHRWRVQLAWSRSLGGNATLTLQMHPSLSRDGRAAFELLLGSSHLSPFHLVFREQRVAGQPVIRQFGVVWGDAHVSLRAGYNGATMSTSLGIALWTGSWSWNASAAAHPFLGYGRQWGLAWSR